MLKLTRTGEGTYTAQFYDPVTKEFVTGLPTFSMTFKMGPMEQTITTVNSIGSVTYSIMGLMGMVTASAYIASASIAWNTKISYPSGTHAPTDTGYASGSSNSGNGNNGNGNNGNGNGKGNGNGNGNGGSGSGSSSGSASSLGMATAASASAGGSSSSSGQSDSGNQGKTVQELIVDESKKPEFWGVIGVIVLLILVFGAYYRTDLQKMIKKSKK